MPEGLKTLLSQKGFCGTLIPRFCVVDGLQTWPEMPLFCMSCPVALWQMQHSRGSFQIFLSTGLWWVNEGTSLLSKILLRTYILAVRMSRQPHTWSLSHWIDRQKQAPTCRHLRRYPWCWRRICEEPSWWVASAMEAEERPGQSSQLRNIHCCRSCHTFWRYFIHQWTMKHLAL